MPISDEIRKQALAKAKERKPELFDSNPKTMPTGVKPEGVKVPVDVKKPDVEKTNTWNAQFQPMIDMAGFDKAANYGNSLHMMKAINGRYNSVLASPDLDGNVKKTIKSLTDNSWAAMNEMTKLSKGEGDEKLWMKYKMAADAADQKLTTQIGYDLKKNYVYNNKDKTITKRKIAEKNNQSWETDDEEGGSTEANAGGGGVNPYAGFNQMKSFETRSRAQIKNTVNPIITTWSKNAFKLLNASNETSSKYDINIKDNTLNLSKSVLSFVSAHGTQSGNKTVDLQSKKVASNLLKQLNNPDLDYNGKIALLKKQVNAETNVIQDMISNMGYYGSRTIYSKYKSVHGANNKYYENGADKYAASGLDNVDNLIINADNYFKTATNDRTEAKAEVLSHSGNNYSKKLIFENLVNDKGVITDYNSWLKDLGYNQKTGDMGKVTFNKSTGDYSYNNLLAIYNNNHSGWDTKTNVVGLYGKPIEYLDKNGRAKRSNGDRVFAGDKEAFHKVMRATYNNSVKEYKAKFSDLNSPKLFKGVLQGVAGGGNEASKAVKLASVDMSLDEDGNMINSQNFKGNNAENIYKLMFNADGTLNKNDVSLLTNFQVEQGKHKKANKTDLANAKKENETTFKTFFNPKADLSDIKISFSKNASLDHYATYTFLNKKTNKKLVMIAPASYLNDKNDFAWKNSYMNVDEGRFLKVGKKILPDRDGLYKNAQIIDDNGIKVALFNYLDSDGVSTEYRLPMGDININEATKYFNNYVSTIMMP
jgi:hypothetical protein